MCIRDRIYPRWPTIHDNKLAFVYDDHLWIAVDGEACRLSSGLSVRHPHFSPDGSSLAFSAEQDGNEEVYRVSVDGTGLVRLTYTGADCRVVCWSQDGTKVYLESSWRSCVDEDRLWVVPAMGGALEAVPWGIEANALSFEPSGAGVLLGRHCGDPAVTEWKRYRGGCTGALWVDHHGDGGWAKLNPVPGRGNLGCPVWCKDDRIYFVSDYEGTGCLYSCDSDGNGIQRHTAPSDFYVRNLSTDGDRIVYHSGGELYMYDTRTATQTGPVIVRTRGVCIHRQPHSPSPSEHLADWSLHPEGVALGVVARGQAFAAGVFDGPVLGFNDSASTKHLLCAWLADGNRMLMTQCEVNSEYDLVVHCMDGSRPPRALNLDSEVLGRPHCLVVCPSKKNHKQLAVLVNHKGDLVLVDLESEDIAVLDRGRHGATVSSACHTNGISGVCWSGCGTWIAYGFKNTPTTSVIKVCDVRTHQVHTVTEAVLEDTDPCFDPEGRYLYFLSSRAFEPQPDHLHHSYSFPNAQRPFALLLRKDVADPFMPELRPPGYDPEEDEDEDDFDSSEEEEDEPDPIEIHFDGIKDRVLGFDVPAGRYSCLRAMDGESVLWLLEQPPAGVDEDEEEPGVLEKYSFCKRKAVTLLDDASDLELSMNRQVMLVQTSDDRLRVLKAGQEAGDESEDDQEDEEEFGRESGYIDLDGRITLHVDPVAEWEYVYGEAWTSMRDLFHDPAAVCGEHWERCRRKYLGLVPRIACRSELSDVISELVAELGTSHAFVEDPETEQELQGKPKVPSRIGGEFSWDPVSYTHLTLPTKRIV
eukprot:TRINITY_DN15424_c0_g1_i2.p1 TRINITY_DN15424_c0_g1~~TRINITY_DN15424_c0_g1_i2.p1  ORF type:complete len:810 (-),score=152.81 TRINITY_DN15424_c0_g1_i2:104-2533(-)